jgi:hypothetical protein
VATPSSRTRSRRFAFVESEFREKAAVSQWRSFNLLLAAMPEKVLDTDHGRDRELKALLLETYTLSNQEKMDVLFKS